MATLIDMPSISYMDVTAIGNLEIAGLLRNEYNLTNAAIIARNFTPLPYLIASEESHLLVLCFLNLKMALCMSARGESKSASDALDVFFLNIESFLQIAHTFNLTVGQATILEQIMDAGGVGKDGVLDTQVVIKWLRGIAEMMQDLSVSALSCTPGHQTLH